MRNKTENDYRIYHQSHLTNTTPNIYTKTILSPNDSQSTTVSIQDEGSHQLALSTINQPLIYKKSVIKPIPNQISTSTPNKASSIYKKASGIKYINNETEFNSTRIISKPNDPYDQYAQGQGQSQDRAYKSFRINKIAMPTNLSRSSSSSNIKGKRKDDAPIINIEDLLLFEEKYTEIIDILEQGANCSNECFEWWNYYFTSSLFNQFENFYKEEESKIVIKSAWNLKLLFIIVLYDMSFDLQFYDNANDHLKSIMNLHYKSFLLICEYIQSKVSSSVIGNQWVGKLNTMVKSKLIHENSHEYDMYLKSYFRSSNESITEIRFYATQISKLMRVILANYSNNPLIKEFVSMFKSISMISVNDLNNFYRTKVIRISNPDASILGSLLPTSSLLNPTQVTVPYLNKESLKKYTLVLDLDETLVNIKADPNNDSKAILRLRPYLFEFLDCVCKYYEIVIFTAGTQDYADPILDAIEQNSIYFDYRLYRHHTIVYNNDFVKDITKLGRDISKVLIVDNMPQNFRLQKDNGIMIKAFWGEDVNDRALYYLSEILQNMALEFTDVRKGIVKYKNDLLNKVSSNISRYH